jgi:hypothetical protein
MNSLPKRRVEFASAANEVGIAGLSMNYEQSFKESPPREKSDHPSGRDLGVFVN